MTVPDAHGSAKATDAAGIISRLRFGARLGSGAAGAVYAGLFDDCEVAIKVIKGPVRSPATRRYLRQDWEREKRTALVLARHPHPNIAPFRAAFEVPEGDFGRLHPGDGVLVMDRGSALDLPYGQREDVMGPIILDADERQPAALRAARTAVGIASALAHLHCKVKTIHRDVKPDNLLVIEDRVCLCDFSASRTQLYDLQRVATRKGIGTMGYLAPEMYEEGARYCSKVDVWSLGVSTMALYNSGQACSYAEFHKLTAALRSWCRNEDTIVAAQEQLDVHIEETLFRMLPENDGPVAALRGVLLMCFRANPVRRPSMVSLLQSSEMQALASYISTAILVPSVDIELLEDPVEESLVVADLMKELVERFGPYSDSPGSRRLSIEELELLRSGFHRALADKDVHSLDLVSAWLDFVKQCPEVDLSMPDSRFGQTLMHAIVQNHRSEACLDAVEEHCEAENLELSEDFINARDDEGYTPLALAAKAAMSTTVCLRLIDLKGDINAKDKNGLTPMDQVCLKTFNRPGEERHKVVTALIAHGAVVPHQIKERQDAMIPALKEAISRTKDQASALVSDWCAVQEQKRLLARQLREAEKQEKAELAQQEDRVEDSGLGGSVAYPQQSHNSMESTLASLPENVAAASFPAEEADALPTEDGVEPPPCPGMVMRSVTEQEDLLKEHLLNRAGHHAGTAFKFAASAGRPSGSKTTTVAKITVDQLLHELHEALPGIDNTEIRRRLSGRWSRGIGYRDFAAWLKSPSKSMVDARRHLPHSDGNPKSKPRTQPEHAAGLRGPAAVNARLRCALLKLFQHVDTDCDGIIDHKEFMQAQHFFLQSAQDESDEDIVPANLSDADLKKDGVVDADEWLEWTMESMLSTLRMPRAKIAKHLEAALANLE